MRCPRCHRESTEGAVFCGSCAAPLALSPEPPERAVDTPVPLDRRTPGARAEPAADAVARRPARRLDLTLDDLVPAPAPLRGAAAEPHEPAWAGRAAAPGAARADSWSGLVAPPAALPDLADTGAWAGPARPASRRGDLPVDASIRARVPPAAGGEEPVEVQVDALEVHLRRPATWRRAAAWVLDAAPFAALLAWGWNALCGAVPVPAGEVGGPWRCAELAIADRGALLLPLAAAVGTLALVYAVLSHALAGATLGKRLVGLRVVGADGRRPSLGRSTARAAVTIVSAGLLGTGLLLALFTRSGRSLHDLVARTWVVEAP